MATHSNQPTAPACIRKARMTDIEAVFALVTAFSRLQILLPRSRADLYESLREFQVADRDGAVVGCAALAIQWENLAEIKSLAVSETEQGSGVGRRLVEACIDEARTLGLGRVFALTAQPGFFERLGFKRISKETLPHKIWTDCVRCPKFPDCDEEAVAVDLLART